MEFNGKVAVVTGGAHGIGKCIAEEFRKGGADAIVAVSAQRNVRRMPFHSQTRRRLTRQSASPA